MKVIVTLGVLLSILLGSETFIIPDELPSILSVIYSNIPTLKKGTDSRLGWGFRLGDRADFQVMVELGPQTNTQPLANQGDKDSSNKRNTLENLAETLYAQRLHEKKEKEQKLKKEKKKVSPSDNTAGAEWLKSWSKSVPQKEEKEPQYLVPRPGIAIGEIDAKSVIPDDSDDSFKETSRNFATNTKSNKGIVATVSSEKPLDDVDLE